MSYTNKEVSNRQIVTLNANLYNVNPSVDQNIPLNLRFVPDIIIVRQISYSATLGTAPFYSAQIYLGLAIDQIIGSFPLGFSISVSPNTTFIPQYGFQNGMVNLQIQYTPESGTGLGELIIPSASYGYVNIVLEFIQFEKK